MCVPKTEVFELLEAIGRAILSDPLVKMVLMVGAVKFFLSKLPPRTLKK